MGNTIGKFGYELRSPKKGDLPVSAIVNIVPRSYSRNADGKIHLSPDLMTEGEIDWYVQAYKDDLDRVGVNGGGIKVHAERPGGLVAAAQKCATYGPLSVLARGGRCTAWSSMRRFDWRLSRRV